MGKHYPLPRFVAWRAEVFGHLKCAFPHGLIPIDKPCNIAFDYWPGDARRRDVPGMIDAMFHCFERFGIIKDDSLFANVKWTTHEIDREKPGLNVEIF
jgi:Holliday junction resolvase RusA-like endonuclease